MTYLLIVSLIICLRIIEQNIRKAWNTNTAFIYRTWYAFWFRWHIQDTF